METDYTLEARPFTHGKGSCPLSPKMKRSSAEKGIEIIVKSIEDSIKRISPNSKENGKTNTPTS